MHLSRSFVALGVILAARAPLTAQQTGQGAIPVRTTTLLVASDSGLFRNIIDIRHLQDGNKVYVNDTLARRVVLLDETFKNVTTVVANDPSAERQYGRGAGRVLVSGPNLTLYLASASQAFAVLGPSGKLERMINIPPVADVVKFANPIYGTPGITANGSIVFRAARAKPDSAPILQVGSNGRIADTIGMLNLADYSKAGATADGGRMTLPAPDEWAMVPDGTIAVVRQNDYHITWFRDNGTSTAAPKMPIEWRKISADEQSQMLDSLREAFGRPVQAAELPEHFPAVRAGQVRSDLEGSIWILPYSSTIQSGYVYDVVNRLGVILERVQIPPGRMIVGFGRRGTLYLRNVAGPNDTRLERVRINR